MHVTIRNLVLIIEMVILYSTAHRNVRLALITIVKEWDDLGEALGLPHPQIMIIKFNHPNDVKQCLKEVVDRWFEGKGSDAPSWKSLCDALKDPLVGRRDVASNIEKKYL